MQRSIIPRSSILPQQSSRANLDRRMNAHFENVTELFPTIHFDQQPPGITTDDIMHHCLISKCGTACLNRNQTFSITRDYIRKLVKLYISTGRSMSDSMGVQREMFTNNWTEFSPRYFLSDLTALQTSNNANESDEDDETCPSDDGNLDQEVIVKFHNVHDSFQYHAASVTVLSPYHHVTHSTTKEDMVHWPVGQLIDVKSRLFDLGNLTRDKWSPTLTSEQSELDSDTSSVTLLIWSEEEELDDELACVSVPVTYPHLVIDQNQNHNTPKGDSTKRPCNRFDHFRGSTSPAHASPGPRLSSSHRSRRFSRESTLSQRSNPEILTEHEPTPSRLTRSARNSPGSTTKDSQSSTGRWGLRIRAVRPNVPELRVQRQKPDTRELIREWENISELKEQVITSDCIPRKAYSNALIAPIPLDTVGLNLSELRSMLTGKPPTRCLLRVFDLCQACTVRLQPALCVTFPILRGGIRSPSSLCDEWYEEETLDSVNPNIVSPIVENESGQSVFPVFVQFDGAEADGLCAPVGPRGSKPTSRPDPTPVLVSSADGHPTTTDDVLAANLRKSRRRVKISLHQCPMPSEAESSSLIVRLRIEPRSDSESVKSKTFDRAARCSTTSATQLKYDALGGRKISSWAPINYIHAVQGTEQVHSNDRERFNGIAECLITSLSSLSIPGSEVESIDTSLSWSLPDSSRPRARSDTKTPSLPDTVIVEVLSDEEAAKTGQPSPTGSDSGVYYIGVASSNPRPCPNHLTNPLLTGCQQCATLQSGEPKAANDANLDCAVSANKDSDVTDYPVNRTRSENQQSHYRRRHLRCYVTKSSARSKPLSRVLPWAYAVPGKRASYATTDQWTAGINESVGACSLDRASRCISNMHAQQLCADPERGDALLSFTAANTSPTQHVAARITKASSSPVQTKTKTGNSLVGTNWKVIRQKPLESNTDWSCMETASTIPCRVSRETSVTEDKSKPLLDQETDPAAAAITTTRTTTTTTSTATTKLETGRVVNRIKHFQLPAPGFSWRSVVATESVLSTIKNPAACVRSHSLNVRQLAEPQSADRGLTRIAKPIFSPTIGPEFYANGFLSRKKSLFRSGEMTISEFEELRNRIGYRIAPAPTRLRQFRKEKVTLNKVPGLSSIASALDDDSEPTRVSGVTHKSKMRLSLCISRQYSTDNSCGGTARSTIALSHGDQQSSATGRGARRRSRFGFCTDPGNETPDALVSGVLD